MLLRTVRYRSCAQWRKIVATPMRAKTLLFAAALASLAFRASALSPRITFVRLIPPTHDLQAERVAIIYAIGDHAAVNDFVQELVDHVNRSGILRIENAVDANHQRFDFASIRKAHPADVYLAVDPFTCEGSEGHAEGSEHDVDGGRVKKTHQWMDATCSAQIDVLRSSDGKKTASFTVRGQGTSPRTISLTDDERAVAFTQAAHYAAVAAAESITPRAVRESIELDPAAPAFDEGYSMISSDRLADARAIWESALRQHGDSASLFFNLAALSEAAGDVAAAGRYFERAQKLKPNEQRYRSELSLFHKRRGPRQ
jgi:tetratricopeptide (TPR) repeat protein